MIPLGYGTVASTEPDVSIMKRWLHGRKSLQLILSVFFLFFSSSSSSSSFFFFIRFNLRDNLTDVWHCKISTEPI